MKKSITIDFARLQRSFTSDIEATGKISSPLLGETRYKKSHIFGILTYDIVIIRFEGDN